MNNSAFGHGHDEEIKIQDLQINKNDPSRQSMLPDIKEQPQVRPSISYDD